jgi:2-polyprenyl-3-methyl-5-hydroxy-6-metoxy-1,4-benzoquinol methylase
VTIHGREFRVDSLEEIHPKIVEMMKKMPKGRVLDFPAGTGKLSWMLYNEEFDVTAADIIIEGETITSEKNKYNQLLLLPISLIIFLVTKLKGEKGKRKYWLDESNSWKILMGGNSLIISSRKIR